MAAPCVAIVGYDMRFFDKLPVLFPHVDAKPWFEHRDEANLAWVANRNSSLQTAYLILAARALGLDCGPMTGFDNAKVDEAFFAGTPIRSNILVNLGHGDPASIFPRSPRLGFDEACQIL
ncbi:MAG TPA: malonic semialdehyde reductase, partial [Thermomonas sp.]|nr:malonic semialdehyde reductase [Thermomonas sp.]